MIRPRRLILSLVTALMVMPVPALGTRMPAEPTPSFHDADRLGDGDDAYPAGSSMLISPPALVLSWAFCRVRHGAVRAQVLVSTPLAEMNDRVLSARLARRARR